MNKTHGRTLEKKEGFHGGTIAQGYPKNLLRRFWKFFLRDD